MRTVSIRKLSGSLMEESASTGELLGVTNDGALVGVVVPVGQQTVQRILTRDQRAVGVEPQDGGIASDTRLSTVMDMLDEPARPARDERLRLARVTIRELSGSRIEAAAQAGDSLVITHDGVILGMLVPVTANWVEKLVERHVANFLNGQAGQQTSESYETHPAESGRRRAVVTAVAPRSAFGPPPHRRLSRASLTQRAIGIKIIADAPDGRERLVGVVTDSLAQIVAGPVEVSLPNVKEDLVFAQILTLVDELTDLMEPDECLLGVGLEIGGHVHDGRVVYSANAQWDHFPLADRLADSLNLPVILQNDANALAVYERRFRGIDDNNFAVVLVTDSGVGCGLVLDGHVYHGVHGMAGELGHVPVEFDEQTSVKCRCENPGCLEGIATPRAIRLRLQAAGYERTYDDALEDPHNDTMKSVAEHAGTAMGRAIASLINTLNLSAIVFHAPPLLFGSPRQFRHDANETVSGVAGHYIRGMMHTIRAQSFSTAAEDCRFIVRMSTDENGAAAAAACLIRHVIKNPGLNPAGFGQSSGPLAR